MPLPPTERDFVGYGERPPDFRWPGDARVAVSLVINVEEGAERSTARGEEADDLGAHWLAHRPDKRQRNLDLESAFEYGSRAGIWRVLRTLREHRARATAFCCAVALESHPAIAAALLRDGHEIADHGHQWDTHTGRERDQELRLIRKSRDLITTVTGTPPTSWYSRDGLNPWTRRDLADEGFTYESNSFNDDLPHWGKDDVNLPVLPYAGDTNDSGLLGRLSTATAFRSHLLGALATLSDETRSGPSVLSVGLHPRLIGRPAYIGALDRFLDELEQRGAWVATRHEIIQHWRAVASQPIHR